MSMPPNPMPRVRLALLAAALTGILLLAHVASAQTPTPRLYLPLVLRSASPSLPFAQRQAVLAAIQQQFDGQPGVNIEAKRVALAAFIRSQPHITAAGVSDDGSIWGRLGASPMRAS